MKITGLQLKRIREAVNQILIRRDIAETFNCIIETYCSHPVPLKIREYPPNYDKVLNECRKEPWYSEEKDNIIYGLMVMVIISLFSEPSINQMIMGAEDEEYAGVDNFIKQFVLHMMPHVTIYDKSIMENDEYIKKIYCLDWKKMGNTQIHVLPVGECSFFHDGGCEEEGEMFFMTLGFSKNGMRFPCMIKDNEVKTALSMKEINYYKEASEKVYGDVFVFGGDFGYFEYLASKIDAVKSITVYEPDDDIRLMMEKYMLPLIPGDKVKMHHGDISANDMPNCDCVVIKNAEKLEKYLSYKEIEHKNNSTGIKVIYIGETYALENIKSIICLLIGEASGKYRNAPEDDEIEDAQFADSINVVNDMRMQSAKCLENIEIRNPDDIRKILSYNGLMPFI